MQEKVNMVLNRRMFDVFLDQEVIRAQRYSLFFSLIIAQPNIKPSNKEIRTRIKKKEIMNTVAYLISKEIRGSDIIGWIDNGKLFILLLETADHNALHVGERLIDLIQTYNFGKEKVSLNISAVRFPTDGVDKWDLIDKANLLLRQARRRGENQILLPDL